MPAIGLDIMKQIIVANPIRSGSIVAGVDRSGNIAVKAPDNGKNHAPVPSGVEARLSKRWHKWNENT
jgi:hypothetical protein